MASELSNRTEVCSLRRPPSGAPFRVARLFFPTLTKHPQKSLKGNAADVLAAFSEMGIKLDDLKEYTAEDQQMPFAQALPQFPIRKRRRCVQEPIGATASQQHIPPWLPRLPQAHTWKASAALTRTEAEAKNVGKQRVEAEGALVGLHKKVPKAFGGLSVPAATPPMDNNGENPFLQPPKVVAAADQKYGEPILSAPPRVEREEVTQGGREADVSIVDRADQILNLPHADGDNQLGVTKLNTQAEEY